MEEGSLTRSDQILAFRHRCKKCVTEHNVFDVYKQYLEHAIPILKYCDGCIMLLRCFSSALTGMLVIVDRMLDGVKLWVMLKENLIRVAKHLKLGWRSSFQQDND